MFCLWAPATILANLADHFYPSRTSGIQAGVSHCCRGKSWMLGPWTLDVFPKYWLIKMTVNVQGHLLSALRVSGWEGCTFANCACSFSWRLALEWCVSSGDLHREGWGQNHRKTSAYEPAALDVMQKRRTLTFSVPAYWMCLGKMDAIVQQSIFQSLENSQWPWGLIPVPFEAPNSVWELEMQVEHNVGEKLFGLFSHSLKCLQHESCSYTQLMRNIFRMKKKKIPSEDAWEWGNAEIYSWTWQPLQGSAAPYLCFFSKD